MNVSKTLSLLIRNYILSVYITCSNAQKRKRHCLYYQLLTFVELSWCIPSASCSLELILK